MPTTRFAVIRGGKLAKPAPKKPLEWPDLAARWRPLDSHRAVNTKGDQDVIPLLEGWVRLIERQATCIKKAL